jgi:hypothetical protein
MAKQQPDDDFTELVDADIPRVDLVDKAANGTTFLIAKAANGGAPGLFSPEFVRELIAKEDETSAFGAAAAQAAVLAEAYGWTPAQIDEMPSLQRAAAFVHAASVRKTKETAVAKADNMDPTEVLADDGGDAPGDPDVPGSPAWEAIDAAAARKWTGILVRAKNAVTALSQREGMEAVTGDSDELMDVLALEDAACHIDSAIGILARFAVDEQAASDLGAEDLAAVGKALGGFDVAALEILEGLAPVVKAGRVLSASNEAAIRAAVDTLQKVLAALPAPTIDDGQPVAKTTKENPVSTATDTATATETPEAQTYVMRAEDVAKAKGKPMFVVCNADGTPVGVCDPNDIMPIAATPDGDSGDKNSADAAGGDAGDNAAVIPGTQTVASPAMTAQGGAVTKTTDQAEKKAKKGKKRDRLAKQLGEVLAPFTEELARGAQLADAVKNLEQRVAKFAAGPDDRNSPLFNGATGDGAGLMVRDGAGTGDELAALKKAVDDAPDEVSKAAAQTELGFASIKARFAGRI